MATSSTLIHIRSGNRVPFQFNPEAIQDTKGSVLKGVNAAGLDMPHIIAAQGGARDLSFSLNFVANGDGYDEARIVRDVSAIRAMSSPEIITLSPRIVRVTPALLVIGSFMELPVIIRRSNVRWFNFNNESDMLPVRAVVDLTMVTVPSEEYMDAAAVRGGGMTKRASTFTTGAPRRLS